MSTYEQRLSQLGGGSPVKNTYQDRLAQLGQVTQKPTEVKATVVTATPTAPAKTIAPTDIFKTTSLGVGSNTPQTNNKTTPMFKSIADSISSDLPQTAEAIRSITNDPLTLKTSPKKLIDNAVNIMKESWAHESQALDALFNKPSKTVTEKVGKSLSVVASAIQTGLSPIVALFNAPNDVPIIGAITKTLTLPFVALGDTAPKVSNKIIDTLPISNQAKIDLKPGVSEVFTLASQIALGKFMEISSKAPKKYVSQLGADVFEKVTKNVISDSGMAKSIRLTADQVREVNRGVGDKANSEMVKSLGLSSSEWSKAVKEGLSVDIPAEKITRIVDKPYWEKIKSVFGKAATDKTIVENGTAKNATGFGGYLEAKNYTPEEIRSKVINSPLENTEVGKKIIKTSIEAEQQGKSIAIGNKESIKLVDPSENIPKVTTKELATSPKALKQTKNSKSVPIAPKKEVSVVRKPVETIKTIKDVKRSLGSIQKEYQNLTEEAKAIATVTKEQRMGLDTNSIAKLKRVYASSSKFKEGDIETIRQSKSGPLVDRVIENVQEKFPDMSEQEAFDHALGLPNKSGETIKGSPEIKALKEKQKILSNYLEKLTAKQKEIDTTAQLDEYQSVLKAQENLAKIVEVPRSQLPVGEGDFKANNLEARISGVKDMLKGATSEELDAFGLSGSNTAHNDQQLADAAKYVSLYQDDAIRVLRDEIPTPKGLLRNAILAAMVDLGNKDAALGVKLSGLFSKRYGQEIQILSQINPDSPVKLMSEIYNIREEEFKKKYPDKSPKKVKEKIAKEIKEKIKKPDKHDWAKFLDEIKC